MANFSHEESSFESSSQSEKEEGKSQGIFHRVDESTGRSRSGEASKIQQAIIWAHKAKAGSVQWVDRCTKEQFNYYLISKKMKFPATCAKWGLLLCSLLDMPSWCRGTPEACSSYVKQLYSPAFPIFNAPVGASISLIFWAIIAARMWIRKLGLGEAYSFHQWHIFAAVLILLGGGSALLSLLFPMFYNLSVVCRPFAFLACTKKLRQGFSHILISVPGFFIVLVSLAICVFVGVWSGMILFSRTPEGNSYFYAWRQGFAQMWILFTTNNTPNVIMPAINANRAYFWFFLFYVLIAVFLLGNVLLARVYEVYKAILIQDFKEKDDSRMYSVRRAFSYLKDDNQCINPQTWRNFFGSCCDPDIGSIQVGDPEDVEYNIKKANIVLQTHKIVIEGQDGIGFEQFKKIMSVFFEKGLYIPRRKPPSQEFTSDYTRQLNNFVLHGHEINGYQMTWDGTMDCIIGLGTCLVFYESWMFAHTYNVDHVFLVLRNRPIFWVLFFMSGIYVFAITTKISTIGFERFWNRNSMQHRFDFCNVYSLMIAELLYIFLWPTVAMSRMIMLLHMARAVRLFVYIEPLQKFFMLLGRLAPIYWQMSMILFIIFWIFCDIGQLWFGGLIYTSNPHLVGTDFASPGFRFFEMNFNCFLDGMITLFTLMCMNNWSDTADGYMQATGQFTSQAYFVAFTIICNMIVLNVLIALVLDCSGQSHAQLAVMEYEANVGISYESILRKAVGAEEELSDTEGTSSSEESVDRQQSSSSMRGGVLRTHRKRKGQTLSSLTPADLSSLTPADLRARSKKLCGEISFNRHASMS